MKNIRKNANIAILTGLAIMCVGCSNSNEDIDNVDDSSISISDNQDNIENNETNSIFDKVAALCEKYELNYSNDVLDAEYTEETMERFGLENLKSITFMDEENALGIKSLVFYEMDIVNTDSKYYSLLLNISGSLDDILAQNFDFNNTIIPEIDYLITGTEVDYKELAQKLADGYNEEYEVAFLNELTGDVQRGVSAYGEDVSYILYCAPEEFLLSMMEAFHEGLD